MLDQYCRAAQESVWMREPVSPVPPLVVLDAAPVPEPGIVSALEAMGFPRELCEKGAVATRNAGVEEAATWILTDGAAGEDVARPSTAPGSPCRSNAPALGLTLSMLCLCSVLSS